MTKAETIRAQSTASGAPAAEAISAAGLTFSAKDNKGRELTILDGVDLSVREGEFVAIVGPSGCGKSTLLNLVAGLIPCAGSKLKLFGAPVTGIDPRIGYVFQTHALLPWRTVLGNVEIGPEIKGLPATERRRQAVEVLRQLGLEGFEDHYPAQISGGMRQRVGLARTLVAGPEVILMDEPFGALDAQTKLLIQDIFINYWESHRKTVLFVTHDLGEAITMADRILVMSARPGRFKATYTVDIPRPRALAQVRRLPQYTTYWESIWEDLKDEAKTALLADGSGR
ncbi:ABC transporter ATP-binding protein [Xanthobacter pseudotagetidis]|uniref:ABC transporter ATP-binding protein n=1 Tax=Xanthobacter pseudotagetidis TaxID=3119911 RepID=UPI003726C2E9